MESNSLMSTRPIKRTTEIFNCPGLSCRATPIILSTARYRTMEMLIAMSHILLLSRNDPNTHPDKLEQRRPSDTVASSLWQNHIRYDEVVLRLLFRRKRIPPNLHPIVRCSGTPCTNGMNVHTYQDSSTTTGTSPKPFSPDRERSPRILTAWLLTVAHGIYMQNLGRGPSCFGCHSSPSCCPERVIVTSALP